MARLRYGLPLWLDGVPTPKRPAFPRFKATDPVETDVVVVGGGLAGAMCAYLFAHAGARVILLEADRVGQGSAASLGWSPETPGMSFRAMQTAYGLRAARRVWDATRKATLDSSALLKRLGIRADVERTDTAFFTRDTEQERALRRDYQAVADASLDALWLTGRKAVNETRAEGVTAAMRTRGGLAYDPYRVALGLVNAAKKAGAQLHEQSPVLKVKFTRKRAEVRTAHGVLDTRAVVIATNEPGPVCAALDRHVRALDSYIVATPALSAPLARAFAARDVILRDADDPPHTLRHTRDGRILFQGAAQPPVVARQQEKTIVQRTGQLMYELSRLYPAISGVMPEYGWTTRLVTGLDGLPLAGPHRNFPHHLFAIGLGHAGVAGAYLAARILLRSYQETSEPADEHFGFSRLPR